MKNETVGQIPSPCLVGRLKPVLHTVGKAQIKYMFVVHTLVCGKQL